MKLTTIPIVPYAEHTGTVAETTSEVFEIPPNTSRLAFHLVAGGLYAGTSPTLDCKVQGGADNSSTWYTALPCYRTGTSPNSIGAIMAFTQLTTAGAERKFTDWPAPYVRALYTLGGETVVSSFGLQMICYED